MGLLSLSLFFGSILPLPATTPEAPLRCLLLTRPRGAMVSPDPHRSTCHTSSSTPTEWPRPRLSVERLRSEGTRSRPPALRGGRGRGEVRCGGGGREIRRGKGGPSRRDRWRGCAIVELIVLITTARDSAFHQVLLTWTRLHVS
jgi:hypothetical protein